MPALRKKYLLDYIPLIILAAFAIYSLLSSINSGIILYWQHYLAYLFLVLTGIAFYKKHQLGVLLSGLTLLLGIFGLLSFNVGIITSNTSLYWTPFDLKISFFAGNPTMLIWLVFHFILSGRYYVGIFTKKYWTTLKRDLENKK